MEAGRIDSLRDGVTQAQSAIQANGENLSQTSSDVQRLQMSLEKTNETLGLLNTNHRKMGTVMMQNGRDLKHTTGLVEKLQDKIGDVEALETHQGSISTQLERLGAELGTNGNGVGRVQEATEILKSASAKAKEQIKSLEATVKAITNGLIKTNTEADVLKEHVHTHVAKNIKDLQLGVEDGKDSLKRLNQGQHRLLADVSSLQDAQKQIISDASDVRSQAKNISQNLDQAQNLLYNTCGMVETTKNGLDEAKGHIHDLKGGHDLLIGRQYELARKLNTTNTLAQNLATGLRNTNAVVMPNLRLDASLPATHGGQRAMSTPRPTFGKTTQNSARVDSALSTVAHRMNAAM
jgi:chromosome segregation ATPase